MTRMTWMSALLLGVLSIAAPAFADDTPTLKDAIAAYEVGKDAQVVTLVDEALPSTKDKREQARLQYLAGEALLRSNKAGDAVKRFEAVLELRPKAVPAMVALGRAHRSAGQPDEAKAALERALETSAKDPEANLAMGELLTASQDLKQAHKHLKLADKGLKKQPRMARAWVEYHLRKDDDKRALQVARSCAKAHKKHPMGPFLQGLALDRAGDHDEAIEAYEEAIQRDDSFIDAHKNLAILCHTQSRTYQDIERTKKSLKHYERYFELGGKDPKLEQLYRTTKNFLEQHLNRGG